MAHYDPSKCVMCYTEFVKGPGGYRRRRLRTLVMSPGTAFKFCQRTVYLDNFVCNKCASIIVKNTVKRGKKRILKKQFNPVNKDEAKGKVEHHHQHDHDYLDPHRSRPATSKSKAPSPNSPLRKKRAFFLTLQKEVISKGGNEAVEGGTSGSGVTHHQELTLGRGEDQLPDVELGEGEKEDEICREQGVEDEPPLQIEKACTYLQEYRYVHALRALCKVSPKAKQAVVKVVSDMIKNELKAKPQLKAFEQEVNMSTVSSFSWEGAIEEASQSLPTTVSCIWAMIRPRKKRGENKSDLSRKAGQMLSTALHATAGKYKFVQASIGVELWKQQASHKVFQALNHTGISQSIYGARNHIDKIGKQHDQELLRWKESQETLSVAPKAKGDKMPESYGLCIDRIQFSSEAKHQSRVQSNTRHAVCFAVKDRVTDEPSNRQVSAVELDPYAFLPSPDVFERQRARAVFLVTRLLSKHLAKLRHLEKKIPSRIIHAHTKQMDMKSQCVTVCAVDADPGSTQGMITVMEQLQKYVPVVEDAPVECLLHGDGLSVEQIMHAQMARSDGEKWDDRLAGFLACPQEFQKELLHMQDANDKFFVASTLAERGTIAQMKNEFNYSSFKKDATTDSFQHVWDLHKFATESHIILCAMKLCGVTSLRDELDGLPIGRRVNAQYKWLTNLAQRVVDFCWAPPDRGDVQIAAAAFDESLAHLPDGALRYCRCKTKKRSEEMVTCCAKTCKHAKFHLSCAGLKKAPDPQTDPDWYCSEDCRENDSYIYCFCHRKTADSGDMIQCHLQEGCRKHEWYHKSCVNISTDDPVPDKWFCSEACELGAENDDEVLTHTKALMFDGLCNLIRREAVREGDGPAMVDDWRADMIGFYEKDHDEFLSQGHFFLACVGGFADPKLQVSCVWNRVANPEGKPGGNIGLDLVNELVNQDYAGIMKSHGRNIAPHHLTRCAQLSGPFGRKLDALFTEAATVDVGETEQSRRADLYDKDIQRFTEEYQPDALFDYIPGRESSVKMDGSWAIPNPKQLGQKLKSFSEEMDMLQNIYVSGSPESGANELGQ